MSKIVFLDTNIFLHYQPFDQIKWLELLESTTITIIIPPVTLRELNKHKELHPRQRVKKRAGDTIKRLFDIYEKGSGGQIRDNVNIEFEDRDPLIDYAEYQLKSEIQDDNLIASMLTHKSEFPESKVVLVTSDFGLTLLTKAGRQGIDTFKMPDKYKIEEQPDPSKNKIRQLQQEIVELKSRRPNPLLQFETGNTHVTFSIPKPLQASQEQIDAQLAEIRQKYPKRHEIDPSEKPNSTDATQKIQSIAMIAGMLNDVTPEEIARYNNELDNFYSAYARYLEASLRIQNMVNPKVKTTK